MLSRQADQLLGTAKGMGIIMKQRISSSIVPSLIIPLLLLSGCGTAHVTPVAAGGEPTVMQILRVNTIPLNHYLPFSPRTITDPHTVQRLYGAAHALPRLNLPPVINCPADLGLEYHLIFSQRHTVMQAMVFYPEGCRRLQIGESDLRALTEPFVHLFMQTIGIAEPELAPMPLYSCTPHSPCLSPTSTH